MYRVLELFHDLKDREHEYKVGDLYPRKGYTPSPSRIAELSGNENARGRALIEVVEEQPKKRPAAKKTKK